VGDIRFNLDDIPRSQVICRDVTDANGTLSVRVYSWHGNDTCHLYAFSNEFLGAPGDATLTLAPPAGADLHYFGTLTGIGGIVKDGGGIQRFNGVNTTGGGLAALAGETVLNPGASVSNGVSIAAGATVTVPVGAVTLGGLTGGGTLNMEGAGFYHAKGIYQHFFTDDASSQISSSKAYTHALDFGTRSGTGATVMGVQFVKAGNNGTHNGYGWEGLGRNINPGNTSIEGISSSEEVFHLLRDMVFFDTSAYNPMTDPPCVATLTGLTPRKQYEVRLYNRSWTGDTTGTRYQTVGFVSDPAVTNYITFAEDGLLPHFVGYRYTALTDTLTIVIRAHAANTSYHIYALTNEEVIGAGCTPVTPGMIVPETYPPETFYERFFIDDETTQISLRKRYTHKLDFGSGTDVGAKVNGVQFTKARATGNTAGYGWEGFGRTINGGNNNQAVPPSHGVSALLRDMMYENLAGDVARLTGLTPGKPYEIRFYNRSWDNGVGGRIQTVSFVPDPAETNTYTFATDGLLPRFIAYRYTPTATTLTILFKPETVQTWHIYALTNEEAYDQTDSPVVLDVDGYDEFYGNVTGWQCWEKRGPGTLLMTGYSTAQGLLTIRDGAFGVGLDGIATLGPVFVEDGARLFGHGTIGGAVNVAPGAVLHAGTASACGTLNISGYLNIEDGANVEWRYASKSEADTFIVGGLTIPNEGTLYTAPIVPKATSPGKHILFTSATTINGPADFTGWTIEGIKGAQLAYGANNTQVVLHASRGTVLILK